MHPNGPPVSRLFLPHAIQAHSGKMRHPEPCTEGMNQFLPCILLQSKASHPPLLLYSQACWKAWCSFCMQKAAKRRLWVYVCFKWVRAGTGSMLRAVVWEGTVQRGNGCSLEGGGEGGPG